MSEVYNIVLTCCIGWCCGLFLFCLVFIANHSQFLSCSMISAFAWNKKKNQSHQSACLQFAVSRLDNLLAVLLFAAGNAAALPTQRTETFRENRVRVVVASVHPVSVHGSQILDLELEQRRSELVRVAESLRKGVCEDIMSK